MKTSLQIVDTLTDSNIIKRDIHINRTVRRLIMEAQKDAWNSALEWAAENVRIDHHDSIDPISTIDRNSILKGKIEG